MGLTNNTPVHDSLSETQKEEIDKGYDDYSASFGDSSEIVLSERAAIRRTPEAVWKERQAIRLRRLQALKAY